MNRSKLMCLDYPTAQEERPKMLYDKTGNGVWTKSAIKKDIIGILCPKKEGWAYCIPTSFGYFCKTVNLILITSTSYNPLEIIQ